MYNANQEEQEILKFWETDKTFEKSVNERPENKPDNIDSILRRHKYARSMPQSDIF